MNRYFLLLVIIAISFNLKAQKEKKWDVSNPPGKHKEVSINTDEGTWMNLDISSDGKTIVFDLLGDIYKMPVHGGQATVLRSGLPWEVQPRFSPDGKKILFTSDAGGGDNIWTMNVDGSDARQITKESFRLLNNAIWMPDGQYIIARKHFTSQRSLGAGEMWMYHISGGSGIQLTKRKNDQQDVNEPSISPDGRYLFYSEDMYPGGFFQYNKDPNSQIYVIKRYDRKKGTNETFVSGPGGACRPEVSNDGKWLAYVRRIRTKSVLFIQNIETGEEFSLYEELSKDQQEAWAVFGVYTGFAWTPDDQNIIIWAKGKIRNIDVKSKAVKDIPFKVNAKHKMAETVRFEQDAAPENFHAKAIRQTTTAPDGKSIVFNAVGYLWKMDLADGSTKRLTSSKDFEFEPSFAPDGKSIVYVSWNDVEMGSLMKMDLASGQVSRLSNKKGIYRTPRFSPDGKSIVYRKESGNYHQGFLHSKNPGIYLKSSSDDEIGKLVIAEGEHPRFSADGSRIYYQTGGYLFGSLTKSYHSVNKEGKDKRTIFNTKYGNLLAPSPDNKWIAFSELHKVYIAPMPSTGKEVGITSKTKAVPVAQVARDAGISLHWSADSKKLHWTLGNEYYSNSVEDRFPFLGKVDSVPPIDTNGIKIIVPLTHDKPSGMIAFTNARIITMEGDKVIENGTIVVEENKIKAVGTSKTKIPKNAKVIDVKGKTIMPGIIDVHAHLGAFRYGLSPQKHWQYYANLAYGVTTTHDPSSNTEMTFSQSEMVKTGTMIGPRIFSTGTILYGADGDFKAVINNLDDARSALRRTKAFGAFSVKSYNQPRREQRQQVMQAARELGINVYPEGGSFFYHNLSMVADGHTGVEHNLPVAPLYDDVIKFWSATKTGNTPTLIVNYGGLNGEYYWYQNTNVWEDERLLAYTPRAIIDSRSRHRTMVPEEEYKNGHILVSESCNKLQNAGVNINLGSHGQIQGIGAHWELWMLQQGGMSNLQALKAATINGAEYLGMKNQLGSIKKGKLADLIILDKNPLENIQNTNSVVYTMVNGRLYDAATMNEVGNQTNERTSFYWEMEGSGNAYPPLIEGTNIFMSSGCSCRQ